MLTEENPGNQKCSLLHSPDLMATLFWSKSTPAQAWLWTVSIGTWVSICMGVRVASGPRRVVVAGDAVSIPRAPFLFVLILGSTERQETTHSAAE